MVEQASAQSARRGRALTRFQKPNRARRARFALG
jgi:hypothetical protein